MKDKIEEILGRHERDDVFGITQELLHLIQEERKDAIEGFADLLKSGEGRKTGVWHYELNDRNEMEASWAGEYISIKEMKKAYETYLTQQSLDKGDTDDR